MKSLGYEFNPKTTLKDFERELIKNGIIDTTITTMEEYFTQKPYSELYFYMGWRMPDYKNKMSLQFSKDVVWHNLDYLGTENGYISLLTQLEAISDGELRFENINFSIDSDGFQWIAFDVNGMAKKWKLLKVNYVDDSFVSRFVYLTEEFNTKGKFTYFDIGDESYVIDYATPEKQTEFIEKTGIQREWLTVGKHFSKPND
ncbi:hypothetical protein C8N46_108124 [Kordia periserrulae]|uniref:Uncharacterized protein n=1 Tax=Kordia periserrulae TaxID=701523 RepID=A0A2T6BUQ1_9FLAO|nr:hypothetical protein [Kordia periserrulae]PTX59811.1 hypothetical protein C8N46_108124 [Kordia periserrulae]